MLIPQIKLLSVPLHLIDTEKESLWVNDAVTKLIGELTNVDARTPPKIERQGKGEYIIHYRRERGYSAKDEGVDFGRGKGELGQLEVSKEEESETTLKTRNQGSIKTK